MRKKKPTCGCKMNNMDLYIYRLTERLSACLIISTCRRVSKVGLEKCVKKIGIRYAMDAHQLQFANFAFLSPEVEVSDQLGNLDFQHPD